MTSCQLTSYKWHTQQPLTAYIVYAPVIDPGQPTAKWAVAYHRDDLKLKHAFQVVNPIWYRERQSEEHNKHQLQNVERKLMAALAPVSPPPPSYQLPTIPFPTTTQNLPQAPSQAHALTQRPFQGAANHATRTPPPALPTPATLMPQRRSKPVAQHPPPYPCYGSRVGQPIPLEIWHLVDTIKFHCRYVAGMPARWELRDQRHKFHYAFDEEGLLRPDHLLYEFRYDGRLFLDEMWDWLLRRN